MSDQSDADILYPSHPRGEPAKAPAADPHQAAADAMFGATAKKDQYVSPDDQKPAAAPAKPGEQPKAPEAKPVAADPVAVKAAADALVKDLALDPSHQLTAEVSSTFAEIGLGKEQAEKVMALETKSRETFWNGVWGSWVSEAETIPEADILAAKSFVKNYGDDGLRDFLNTYRAGDNPHLIRAFARAARAK